MRIFDLDKWHEIYFALRKNPLRTFFTAFGVFWGIFMLIIMMGAGEGLYNGASKDLGDMSTNSVFMWTQRTTIPYKGFPRGRFFRFNNDDTKALVDNIPEIKYIAPRLQGWSRGEGSNNVIRGERTGSFNIQGDYPEINFIDPVNVTSGRFINHIDIDELRKVAVIGVSVFNEMFEPQENPIGEYIQIQGVYFKVIGMFQSKKNDQQAEHDNQAIFIPFTTLQKVYNYGDMVGWYSITAKDDVRVEVIENKAKDLLKQRHSVHPDDIRAVGSFNLDKEWSKMTNLFNGISILVWIVGIGTLLAGVIGVSNIMLIVVKERTKEIGIQRAIGAAPSIIITQIIVESVLLTAVAGYFGLAIGVGILELVNFGLQSSGADSNMFSNPSVDFTKAMWALGILVISGIFAGMIPARRAVNIKPIDALRDEV
ncbi:MAG: ABC transporter permease [Bacteroidales bacterium]|nr:ABC transporter permease [Bacteroidales bacterium]MCF8403228.1 ABC transporter permease [Bacteroidales bacterium]